MKFFEDEYRFYDIRLQKISWPWNGGQRSLKVIESDIIVLKTKLLLHNRKLYVTRKVRVPQPIPRRTPSTGALKTRGWENLWFSTVCFVLKVPLNTNQPTNLHLQCTIRLRFDCYSTAVRPRDDHWMTYVRTVWRYRNYVIIIIFLPSVSRIPRGLKKKLEENCRSDHYSGQSSNTKESCSSTPEYYYYYYYYEIRIFISAGVVESSHTNNSNSDFYSLYVYK